MAVVVLHLEPRIGWRGSMRVWSVIRASSVAASRANMMMMMMMMAPVEAEEAGRCGRR